MQPTRRRYLGIASVGIGAGVAGCLSSGSNISYPEPEPEDTPTDGSEETPDESEPEPEPVENINTRLADQTRSIYEELRWFETEYDEAIRQYRNRVREVVDALNSLLERLDTNGRIDADELEDVKTFADEVAIDVNGALEPHFTNEFNYWAINRKYFPEVEKYRKRADWDRVETELRNILTAYRGASNYSELESRHSPNPIDNRLYGRFGGTGQKMFEVRYISDNSNHHTSTRDEQNPGYGVYVVNDASREISFLQRPIGGAPLRVQREIDTAFAPFEESTDRSYRFYVRVHNVGGGGAINPGQTASMPVYAQKYDDLRAAETAFESVMADKEIEDTEAWGEETWNQVLYSRDGDRVYAYFIRAGSFLYAIGPSQTAWEEREDGWNALLEGTWILPS